MALAASDLFVVQKDPGGTLAKVTAADLNTYLEAADSVTYKKAKDFGASLADPANDGPVNVGDLYINTGDTVGAFAWSNPPNPIPDPVAAGDRCIWNGATWDYFSDGIQDAGVETVDGGIAITITGTAANPTVNADYADESTIGVVQIATDADVTAGNVGNPAALVVTAKQLREEIDGVMVNSGSGTVTSVTAAAGSPLTVVNNTTTPEIDITEATEVAQGTVRFATDVEAGEGTVTDAAITPAQLVANVPTDLGVETIVETDDSDAVSGAMIISGPTDGEVKIGVQKEVFCPYDFSSLPEV